MPRMGQKPPRRRSSRPSDREMRWIVPTLMACSPVPVSTRIDEQGRSCPLDTRSRYRTPPARDPGERGRAATANRATFLEETMAHAVAPEAIVGVIAFLVSDARRPIGERGNRRCPSDPCGHWLGTGVW